MATTTSENRDDLASAMELLHRASRFAKECSRDPWDFAIEIHDLLALGMTRTDLRLMICRGQLLHGVERSRRGKQRVFRRTASLAFTEQSCFMLTPAGAEMAGETLKSLRHPGRPHWDEDRRELWFDEVLVKRFTRSAPHQEAILAALEKSGWAETISNPSPSLPRGRASARLHNAIQALNQQKKAVIRFRQVGQRLAWEPQRLTIAKPSFDQREDGQKI